MEVIQTKKDVGDRILRLEARVHGLEKLLASRIQGALSKDEDNDLVTLKNKKLNYYLNNIAYRRPIEYSVCYSMLMLGILHIISICYMSLMQLRVAVIFLSIPTLINIVLYFVATGEQIRRLMTRQAKLIIMVKLYVAILLQYAIIYLLVETAEPQSFSGYHFLDYEGPLKLVQQYLHMVYYSEMVISTIGILNIFVQAWYVKIIVFSQLMIAVAHLNILYCNWVQ